MKFVINKGDVTASTDVPNFNSISQVIYELQWFEKLKIEHIQTHSRTHIHTYIRTWIKNQICLSIRNCRVLRQQYFEFFFHENNFLREEAKNINFEYVFLYRLNLKMIDWSHFYYMFLYCSVFAYWEKITVTFSWLLY